MSAPEQTTLVWATMAGGREYARRHAHDVCEDDIIKRARLLREKWARHGVFHTENTTSIVWVMWGLDQLYV